MSYYSELNEMQRSVVDQVDGPLLVLAAAGTGKTKTITSRILRILEYKAAQPEEIMAVTFTNKAAQEMRSRTSSFTAETNSVCFGTFHSIAARILRKNSRFMKFDERFTIIDQDDQYRIIKSIMSELFPNCQDNPKTILYSIKKWKDMALSPGCIPESLLNSGNAMLAAEIYSAYQERLQMMNLVDFGDLLLHNINLFTEESDVLLGYQNKFRYIMVDEYQDTNVAQYIWLRLLTQKNNNICCVGDDDQSIYSWRGAEIENIMKFSKDFPNAKIIRLEENYRSTGHILAAASSLISHNETRLKKTLWTCREYGHKVAIMKFRDSESEALYITSQILGSTEYKTDQIAILLRAGFQSRVFEDYFSRFAVPYKIIGGVRFYDRQEIKDILAYLRLAINHDDDASFNRIINNPKRGIGSAKLKKIYSIAHNNFVSAYRAALSLIQESHESKSGLASFVSMIEEFSSLVEEKQLDEIITLIADKSGYMNMLQTDNNQSNETRIENIKELCSAVRHYSSAHEFLEHIGLVSDFVPNYATQNQDEIPTNSNIGVSLMTVHSAKGTEFPCVFLPGWEEGVFPHRKSVSDKTGKSLEEERRLAYVAITRAKEKLFISSVERREMNHYWQPMQDSRFISEISSEHTLVK